MARDGNHASDPQGHGSTQGHGSLQGYLIGFLLSVVLTAIPFWLVMTGALSSVAATALIISLLAAVQIVVHVYFFLHVHSHTEGGWTLISFIFTGIIVVITIGGSVWAMYHMNTNMMPMEAKSVMQMP